MGDQEIIKELLVGEFYQKIGINSLPRIFFTIMFIKVSTNISLNPTSLGKHYMAAGSWGTRNAMVKLLIIFYFAQRLSKGSN